MRLSEDVDRVRVVALAIAKVIARKTLMEDPKFRRLDQLGQVMAVQNLAEGMVGAIAEEAVAAMDATEKLLEVADERAA